MEWGGSQQWFTVPLLFMYLGSCARDLRELSSCDFILFDYLLFLSGFCCSSVYVLVYFLAGLLRMQIPKSSTNWLGMLWDKCICQSFNLRPARLLHADIRVLVVARFPPGQNTNCFHWFYFAFPPFSSPNVLTCWWPSIWWYIEFSRNQKSVTNKLAAYKYWQRDVLAKVTLFGKKIAISYLKPVLATYFS